MSLDPSDQSSDPFGPPATPVTVGCLHCGKEYESYLIEWRVKTKPDGTGHGFWCCPTPGCDGIGFGFDILPTDPNYQDEHGGWVHGADEEDFNADAGTNGFHEGGPERPPEAYGDDEDIPW